MSQRQLLPANPIPPYLHLHLCNYLSLFLFLPPTALYHACNFYLYPYLYFYMYLYLSVINLLLSVIFVSHRLYATYNSALRLGQFYADHAT